MKIIYTSIGIVAMWLITTTSLAQKTRSSPIALAAAKHQDTYVKVMYGQPRKKGREIFGSLVPFGKVWRTGANEATEITTTQDIKINNTLLNKGTYSIFTIPNKDSWTVIFNTGVGMWGGYDYNEKQDVLRFNVPTQSIDTPREAFIIEIIEGEGNKADMVMAWDKTKISFPIEYVKPASTP